jgi:hypothetical protein
MNKKSQTNKKKQTKINNKVKTKNKNKDKNKVKNKDITKSKRQTKIRVKPRSKSYNPDNDYFINNARINSTQRKYCHCLMSARNNLKNDKLPYGICIGYMKKQNLLNPSKKTNTYNYKQSKKYYPQMNPKITHCLMNYDLYKYNIKQIRHLANEKGIRAYYYKKDNVNSKKNPKISKKSKKKKSNTK